MAETRQYGDIATKLLMENDRVRIWEMRLAPGERSALHRHQNDYVMIQIAGDKMAADFEPDSGGPWGGTRAIENLMPIVRELGLAPIFWDVQFTYSYKTFEEGKPPVLDPAMGPRIDKFLAELVWMAKTMRYGRENIALERP